MTDPQRWSDRRYQEMESVAYDSGRLVVGFNDGSCAILDAATALPQNARRPNWAAVGFDEYEIHVPTADGLVEIPWSTIRALTDGEYSAHLATMAAEQARLIGRRIKALRQSRGLTTKELSERASITPESLSRVEHGRDDVALATVQRILAAMGHSLGDLTASDPSSVT